MNKPFSPDVEDYISRVLDIIDNPEKKDDKEEDELEFVGGGSPGHGAPPFRKKKHMDEDSSETSFMDKAWDTAKDVGMFAIQNPEILAALEEDMDEEVCECGGMMNEEGMCSECGKMMYESNKKTLKLTESELVSLISRMVSEASVPGQIGRAHV